jgi:hypothetical protein
LAQEQFQYWIVVVVVLVIHNSAIPTFSLSNG